VPSLPDRTDVAIVNAGFKFSEDSPHIDVPPPRLGEHNEEILASLGFDAGQRREILAGNEPGPKA
jgi:crotonobetainyl-CoA:carnitine CoA-transferase CaiB-like acyl-CoA transferase